MILVCGVNLLAYEHFLLRGCFAEAIRKTDLNGERLKQRHYARTKSCQRAKICNRGSSIQQQNTFFCVMLSVSIPSQILIYFFFTCTN